MHQAASSVHIVDADSVVNADEIGGTRMKAETVAHERLGAPAAVAEALKIPVGEDVLFTEASSTSTRHRTGFALAGFRFRGCRAWTWNPSRATRRTSCASLLAHPSLTFRRFVIEAATADVAVAALLEIQPERLSW